MNADCNIRKINTKLGRDKSFGFQKEENLQK